MIIRAVNNLDVSANYSFMSVSKTSGVGTIDVKNINQFSANWAVQIGKTGEERSEIKIISASAPSGTSLIFTANTTYEHPSDTPVYAIKFDKLIFKRSTSGTSGTATAITDGTVNITPDSLNTEFDDTSGAAAYAYKVAFYNSVTTQVSSDSDWLTSSGYSFYSLAKMRDRIKKKLFSASYLKDDQQIDDWMNEWLEEMNNAIVDVDKSYSLGTVNVSFGTNGYGTVTSTDFKSLKRLWITYDGVNDYRATKDDLSTQFPNERYANTHPYYAWFGDDVFQIKPSDSIGTAKIVYYKRTPVLVNDTDELPFAMRSYSKSFVNYALSEAYYNDDKDDKGDRYFGKAKSDKELFIKEITPRNFTGVQMMDISTTVFGEDDELMFM